MSWLLQLAAATKSRAFWVCTFAALATVVVVIGTSAAQVGDDSDDYKVDAANRSTLLFIGDSLTERGESSDQSGWVTLMRSEYSRSADIISRGYSGYNSRWTLEYVLPLVERDLDAWPSPALITVWLGANDAALSDGMSSQQHVPVDDYSANLFTIVERLRAKTPTANFVFIAPPLVDDDHRRSLNGGKLDRSNEQAGIYPTACVERATHMNVPVLDLYSFFNSMEEDERNACLVDGLHSNVKDNQLMQQQLVATIKDAFPELVAALVTPQLPEWRALVNEAAST